MKQHTKVKIPVHSLIDLITNSSTEIFVNSTNSVKPAKEILAELLKLEGVETPVDELFEVTVEEEDYSLEQFLEYEIFQYYEDDFEELKEKWDEDQDKFVQDFKEGKYPDLKKWAEAEVDFDYHVEKNLVIKVKDEKYAKFAELLKKFLTSAEHYEHSWG